MVTQPNCGITFGQQLPSVLRKLPRSSRETSSGFMRDCTLVSREQASPRSPSSPFWKRLHGSDSSPSAHKGVDTVVAFTWQCPAVSVCPIHPYSACVVAVPSAGVWGDGLKAAGFYTAQGYGEYHKYLGSYRRLMTARTLHDTTLTLLLWSHQGPVTPWSVCELAGMQLRVRSRLPQPTAAAVDVGGQLKQGGGEAKASSDRVKAAETCQAS